MWVPREIESIEHKPVIRCHHCHNSRQYLTAHVFSLPLQARGRTVLLRNHISRERSDSHLRQVACQELLVLASGDCKSFDSSGDHEADFPSCSSRLHPDTTTPLTAPHPAMFPNPTNSAPQLKQNLYDQLTSVIWIYLLRISSCYVGGATRHFCLFIRNLDGRRAFRRLRFHGED